MSEPHTLRSFDEALDKLTAGVVIMGEQVCEMIHAAGKAVIVRNSVVAAQVVEQDLAIDRQFEDIRARCLDVLLRFHPVARDLRQVMAVEHAVGDLERAADHA
ncbi:MAG: phosphate signaling complex PhoU family protein, partial [Dietzia cercidiphylli]